MRRGVFLLFLLVGSQAQAYTYRETGNSLLLRCESGEKGNLVEWGMCVGYIIGIADGAQEKLCIPTEVANGQLLQVWMKWAKENPEYLHFGANALVLWAFSDAWPCP